jgi:hypothetical protein
MLYLKRYNFTFGDLGSGLGWVQRAVDLKYQKLIIQNALFVILSK